MKRKNISVDRVTYALLRAAKRPGESFSAVIRRLLAHEEPSFSAIRYLFDEDEAKELAETIRKMRGEEVGPDR
ncbi:MAG: antitoxin VapB family protein [Thermoplasmata archaeon]